MHPNAYVRSFNEINQADLPLVGGKAASLGELRQAGFAVPDGFCISTEAYQAFITHNQLEGSIAALLETASPETIDQLGAQIRGRVQQAAIPVGVEQAITAALRQSAEEAFYAIRSSATAEDLAYASFAGQQDTYLNIQGESGILAAVRNCWASLFTDRAILYRIQNHIPHNQVYMAVIVQKMVFPEVSGILFTADPVTGNRNILSIDAGFGLGEALVSGIVSPDIYKFRKSTRQIESKTIAEKKLAIVPVQGGGTQKIEITGEQSHRQVLSDAQIEHLADLGMRIEKHYGSPQDIEWCIQAGELYIVQSRAITSLFPLPEPIPQDEDLHVYASFNHFQVMTDPISPLGIDILRIVLSADKDARSAQEYRIARSAAGRIYLDLSELLQYKPLRKGVPGLLKNADVLAGTALSDLVRRPDFEARIKKRKGTAGSLGRYILPVVIRSIINMIFREPEGTIMRMRTYIEKEMADFSQRMAQAEPGKERLDLIREGISLYDHFPVLLPMMAPAMLGFKVLGELEHKWLGTSQYMPQIVTGLEGNITTEMGLLIGDMADLIRESPDLLREFENPEYKSLIARINQLQGEGEFTTLFNTFIDRYGMRAAGEIDTAQDRWAENPEPLAKAMLSIVKTSEQGAHRREYQTLIENAKTASEDLIREVETRHGKFKGLVIRRVVRVVRNVLPVREHPKYFIMKLILIAKGAILDEARTLVKKGQLASEKDVFYLTYWELYEAAGSSKVFLGLVEQRKEAYQHFKKLRPPRLLTSDGEEITASYSRENIPEGALVGMPVSAGVIEGTAKVIMNPYEGTVDKGEILVAPFTDPGWTPLFINAAGLVTEVGGILTHGTVVAREYGIPAVVGVEDATRMIKTGQRIRVDGSAGYVVIMED